MWRQINLDEYFNAIYKRILAGDYGKSGLTDQDLLTIALSRRQLYNRWYGEMDLMKTMLLLKMQAAEYATMGHIINKHLKNTLILGADHARMAPFIGLMPQHQYLRNNYLGVK